MTWMIIIFDLQGDDMQDFSEEMADPEFLHSVLGSLPNVDPNSEAVRAAIGQATQQSSNKTGYYLTQKTS